MSQCMSERVGNSLFTSGWEKKILVLSHPDLEMIAKPYDSISSSEEKMLCRNGSWPFLIYNAYLDDFAVIILLKNAVYCSYYHGVSPPQLELWPWMRPLLC